MIQHRRHLPIPIDDAGALLDTLAGPNDQIWTSKLVGRMRLDNGLVPGSKGGHGPVRYHIVEYEPGLRVRFEFDANCGLTGWHEFNATADEDGTIITHVLAGRPYGWVQAAWPLILALHNAAIEDMFDNLERSLGGQAHPQQRTSWLIRTLGAASYRSDMKKHRDD